MSGNDFGSAGDGAPFFDLSKLLGGAAGGDPWATAAELAAAIASEGGSEPNVDPVVRMQLQDLVRVAELHVAQATAIDLPSNTVVTAVTKSTWSKESLKTFRPFFERFGEALGTAVEADQPSADDIFGAMLGQLFQSVAPMMVSASAGSMLGHLGQRALGQYDLPIPRNSNEILMVPSTIATAAQDWDVGVEDLQLWLLIHELTAHALLSRRHVRARVESLLLDYAAAFRPNPDLIAEQFGGLDAITDLSQLQELSETFNDPAMLLSIMHSPAHDLLIPQFDALVAAILGFVRYTVDTICTPLVPSHDRIKARFTERWTDEAPADRFMERLLGLDITVDTLARGDDFIDGVLERAGDDGLHRLWGDELDLPTAAEIDAPGLWLARIGLDTEMGGQVSEVPDDLSGLDDLD